MTLYTSEVTQQMPSTRKITKLLNMNFRGIFFKPVEFETEGLHYPDVELLIEKSRLVTYIKDNSLDLKEMAAPKSPFKFFFPQKRREEGAEYWAEKSRRVTEERVPGGVIRLIIEEDQDDVFIKRLEEQIPERNITRNDDFSIPRKFFENLMDNGIYVYDDIYDREGENLYLKWDFDKMKNPHLEHASKEDREERISIYKAYGWYAEKQYTALILGASQAKEIVDPDQLIEKGIKYCREEILKDYKGKNSEFIFIIDEKLESPHGEKPKTIKELKIMVFGELEYRKKRQKGIPSDNDIGLLLSNNDIENIKNTAEEIREWLSEEEQDRLDAAKRDSIIVLAKLLNKHLANPSIRGKLNNSSRVNTIKAICDKIDASRRSLNRLIDKDGESSIELIDIVKDDKSIEAFDAYENDRENRIRIDFMKKDFKSICLDGFKTGFDCEGKDKNFFQFIQEQTWQEIVDMLVPYTEESKSNTKSELFCAYCRILELSFDMKARGALHTRFAKKIRAISGIIKEKANREVKEVYK